MSASKYTPGPWFDVGPDSSDGVPFIQIESGDEAICEVSAWLDEDKDQFFITDETRANARLIATCPDMAALLAECAATFRRYEVAHRSKRSAEAELKAVANGVMAQRCEDLLAKAGSGSE